jgi:hypothetical protein
VEQQAELRQPRRLKYPLGAGGPPVESGSVREPGRELVQGGAVGGESPRVVEQMAVEPAGSSSAAGGRFGVGSLGGHGRGGRGAPRAPAGSATDHADIARFASATPGRATEGWSLARAATVASDRQERASAAAARRSARPRSAWPSRGSSVGHLANTSREPRPRRWTWRFAIAPSSFRDHEGRARRWRRRAARSRSPRRSPRSSPNPGPLATARPPRPTVAQLRLGARPRQGRRLVTRLEACSPRMGIV